MASFGAVPSRTARSASAARKAPASADKDKSDQPDGSGGGAWTDPYADSRAKILETVKWLIAVYSAFLAWIVAGASISNLGALGVGTPAFVIAVLALLVAVAAIMGAIRLAVQLLQPSYIFLSEIRSRMGTQAGQRPAAPTAAPMSADVQQAYDEMAQVLEDHEDEWRPLGYWKMSYEQLFERGDVIDRTLSEGGPENSKAKLAAREEWSRLEPFFRNLLSFGKFLVLHFQFRRALLLGGVLSFVAFLALGVFSVVVKSAGSDARKSDGVTVIVSGVPGARAFDSAAADLPRLGSLEFSPGVDAMSSAQQDVVREAGQWLRSRDDAALVLRASGVPPGFASRTLVRLQAAIVQAAGGRSDRVFPVETDGGQSSDGAPDRGEPHAKDFCRVELIAVRSAAAP